MKLSELSEVREMFNQPLFRLVDKARDIHKINFTDGEIQVASLLSIKTGGCPENCSYCPQSAHYSTEVKRASLMDKESVLIAAKASKKNGATRFCLGAASREVKEGSDFEKIIEMVKAVSSLGLEVCCTLGMLTKAQAKRLKDAGLHAYNHNIDTSREYYSKVIQTRTYDDRLQTIQNVREAGLTVCTGGILGLGESEEDRISLIHQLASFSPQPESVTVNTLVPFEGTPLEHSKPVLALDIVRVIAAIRIFIPNAVIRLSAGRLSMSDEAQFLCFLSGANSIFLGDKLLTSPNPSVSHDSNLLKNLGYQMKTETNHNFDKVLNA